MEKEGKIDFKSDDEESNPYDSEEKEYDLDLKAQEELDNQEYDEEDGDSYDSELEAEFFGKKDPGANGRNQEN